MPDERAAAYPPESGIPGAKFPVSRILPPKNIRDIDEQIMQLSSEERRVWNLVPADIRREVAQQRMSLDDVLQLAVENVALLEDSNIPELDLIHLFK